MASGKRELSDHLILLSSILATRRYYDGRTEAERRRQRQKFGKHLTNNQLLVPLLFLKTMGSNSAPLMDKPNLVCPVCGYQFTKRDVSNLDRTSFENLVNSCSCPSCSEDIHPEDALLEYFERIPTHEVLGRPNQIGGFASVGTRSLNVGETVENSLIGGSSFTIDQVLLAETDQPAGQTIRDLDGMSIEWYPGPQIVDDSVVVDIIQVGDSEVGFVTSKRQSSAPSDVTVAYNFHPRLSDIPQPPWIELLGSVTQLYHRGEGLAMLPLLISCFDNHINRQLHRSLRSTGRSNQEIEQFFSDYYSWEDRCKEGLEEVTSKRFPAEKPNLYNDFYELRKDRNNGIIHIDPDDNTANIPVHEMQDHFETVMNSILTICDIFKTERQSP